MTNPVTQVLQVSTYSSSFRITAAVLQLRATLTVFKSITKRASCLDFSEAKLNTVRLKGACVGSPRRQASLGCYLGNTSVCIYLLYHFWTFDKENVI